MTGHCVYGPHGPVPCASHAAAAEQASAAASAEYLATTLRDGRDAAAMAGAVGHAAWQAALERPLTPCDDGSDGLGWPSDE